MKLSIPLSRLEVNWIMSNRIRCRTDKVPSHLIIKITTKRNIVLPLSPVYFLMALNPVGSSTFRIVDNRISPSNNMEKNPFIPFQVLAVQSLDSLVQPKNTRTNRIFIFI